MLEFADRIEKEIDQDDSAEIGEKMLLYGLIRALKPKVVLETGTHRGKTSLYMLNALYDNGFGKLYTCDPSEEYQQRANFNKFPELEKLVVFEPKRGVDFNIEEGIDFFFCDGFHGKKDVLEEIDHFFPKLNHRAVVVFHDCDENYLNDKEGVNGAIYEKGLKFIHIMSANRMRIYVHENISTNS